MELKNEERSRIFAAYWGAKFIVKKEISAIERVVNWRCLQFINSLDYQLLLSPLSAISDEHAIEVARMSGIEASDLYTDQYHISKWNNLQTIGKQIAIDLIQKEMNIKPPRINKVMQIIDKLREWRYNVGYGKYSPADLVNMGIVIETKTENI